MSTAAAAWRRWGWSPGRVLETYPGLRIGNYLYFALQAHVRDLKREPLRVLDSGLDPAWLDVFPLLKNTMATHRQVRWWGREAIPPSFFQAFGKDFSLPELESFVSTWMASQVFSFPLNSPVADLVVSVRRGDYASPPFRDLYAFDVADYVRNAVLAASHRVDPRSIQVVSDDVPWCRSELAWLRKLSPLVNFGASANGSVGDFMTLARGRALILANSTFSYWAAYVSQALHGAEHLGVWAPAFHQANVRDGEPWQHDPRWTSLEVIRPSART